MRKRILLAVLTAAALCINGCGDGATNSRTEEEMKGEELNSEDEAENERAEEREEEREEEAETVQGQAESESTAPVSEAGAEQIAPATSRSEALALYDQAFNEHDFSYLLAACVEPYGKENVDFLLANGLLSEEEYWGAYDNSQGSYYEIGVFEGYSSEITGETQVEDPKAIEEELLQTYGYECTVQDAYDVTYNRTATGTEGSAVNEGYHLQMVQNDGCWYIWKMQ